MKQVKRTPVPLPGQKSTLNPKSTSSMAALSQEFITSDDDSADHYAPPSKTAEKPKTTIAIHTPNGVVPRKQKQSHTTTKKQKDATSDSDDSSSGEDAPVSAQKPARVSVQPSQPQSYSTEARPGPAYDPPKGYYSVPLNEKTMSETALIFKHLQGKQLWHITAPADVSLQDLEGMALHTATSGETVLEYKGTNYGFCKKDESEENARQILVPHSNGYKAVPARISHTLHLQVMVKLAELSSNRADQNTGSEAAASITRSTIRAPRPQIKGLKMRFLPTGFGGNKTGTLGDSDSEGEAAQHTAGLGVPTGLNLPKRKHTEADEEVLAKKHKKHRTAEDIQRKEERRAKKEKKRAHNAALEK